MEQDSPKDGGGRFTGYYGDADAAAGCRAGRSVEVRLSLLLRIRWALDRLRKKCDALNLVKQNRILRKKAASMENSILLLQSRLREYETFNEWEHIEYFNDWEPRSFAMSRYIDPECKSLLDLGCGEMHIRKFLDGGIEYHGCDYKKRDNGTIVCDLAKGEFPSICVDTIFMAGVLEYLANWRDVLRECSLHCRQLVMSYCTVEAAPDRDPRWVNAISDAELIGEMLKNGFGYAGGGDMVGTSVIFDFVALQE